MNLHLEDGKMKRTLLLSIALAALTACTSQADIFGTVGNQFSIDFTLISGSTNPASGIPAGSGFSFTGVADDYRIGKFEITNDQWDRFKSAWGPVAGSPTGAYDGITFWTGTNIPANAISWYEAAQFVNWLNTSTGHQPAYKFTGTPGTSNYTLGIWNASEADGGINLYRHKDAFYFLPTENEWVKAAYWNGTAMKTYANASSGDLVSGLPNPAKWNYDPSAGYAPWAVGSGAAELNGTYDMMGNLWEWMEGPYHAGEYLSGAERCLRSGAYGTDNTALRSSYRIFYTLPNLEGVNVGFRVASVPEPATILLLTFGGLLIRKR
jgi:hypothetical protein